MPSGLSELEVLGISANRGGGDSDVSRELRLQHSFALHEGSRIVLAQSGRARPDEDIRRAFSAHFDVCAVSGMADRVRVADFGGDLGESNGRSGGPGGGMGAPGMGGGPGGGMGGAPGMGGGPGAGMDMGAPGGGGRASARSPRATVLTVEPLDKAFRLAAARAGADSVVIVWDEPSGSSADGIRVVVIDVATGKWASLDFANPRQGEDKAALFDRLADNLADGDPEQ